MNEKERIKRAYKYSSQFVNAIKDEPEDIQALILCMIVNSFDMVYPKLKIHDIIKALRYKKLKKVKA